MNLNSNTKEAKSEKIAPLKRQAKKQLKEVRDKKRKKVLNKETVLEQIHELLLKKEAF